MPPINKENIEKEHTFVCTEKKKQKKLLKIPLAIEYGKRLTQDWKKQHHTF
jgi:hypothetical protein